MRDAVIVESVRTPIGKRAGSLKDVHPVDLTSGVLNSVLQRTGVDPERVDDVIWGVVNQLGDQSTNLGRLGALGAGWPVTVPGTTVDRACGSSQQALHFAAAGIVSGQYDLVVAGGTEMMSRVPLGAARASGEPYGRTVLDRFGVDTFSQGVGAEMVADKWSLGRQQLDEFALRSHELAAAAWDKGEFDTQVVRPSGAEPETDEGIRRGGTLEKLGRLTSPFREGGSIHAGNSSQISDGAAAMMVTSSETARELGLTPIVRFHTGAVIGDDPVMMLTAPIEATRKALHRAGLQISDIGVFEVNEAFASVPLAWMAELAVPLDRVNPWGGAIAVGHPLGASGAILMTRMVHHMRSRGIRFGLQTMCEAGGLANATIVELVE